MNRHVHLAHRTGIADDILGAKAIFQLASQADIFFLQRSPFSRQFPALPDIAGDHAGYYAQYANIFVQRC